MKMLRRHCLVIALQILFSSLAIGGAEEDCFELRLQRVRNELLRMDVRQLNELVQVPKSDWYELQKGEAAYFRNRTWDVIGDYGQGSSSVSVTVSRYIKRDKSGRIDLSTLQDSKEIKKILETKGVRDHIGSASKCFISITFGYTGDMGDRVFFPAFSVQISPLPNGKTLTVYLASGLEDRLLNEEITAKANGKVAASFPKESSMFNDPKLDVSGTDLPSESLRVHKERE